MKVNTNRMVSLNVTNYHLWEEKMKDLLFVKKNASSFLCYSEAIIHHQQVCDFIRHFVDDNVYNHIVSKTHVRTLWEKIESLYASNYGNNKLFLLNSIVNLKFKEGASLSNHLNEFQEIFY
ncbi:hypothetical protein CR513_06050, partial [Mucuna pruriens]